MRGVGEDLLDGADIAVDEVLIDLHPDELGIEKFALFELYLAALDGEDLGFQRFRGSHIVPAGEVHEHHVALYAAVDGAELRAVHIEGLEAGELRGRHVPRLHLHVALHAVRVDDLTDLDEFGRLGPGGLTLGKDTHGGDLLAFDIFFSV